MVLVKQFLSDELHLDPSEYLSKFQLYENLLLDWNKKINLISRKSNSIEEHVLNSIFFLTKYSLNSIHSIVDIGTGGGFPGIPLKILFPELRVLLIDSIQKKVNVLNDIIKKMNLTDIQTVCGRAENISLNKDYKYKYDAVISKSVSSLGNLFEWGRNFLNEHGKMLCIKGGDISEELNSLNKLKYDFKTKVVNFELNEAYHIEDKKLVVISTGD